MMRAIGVALALLFMFGGAAARAQSANRITILYDAFGQKPGFTQDWGFAALIEHDGKRILFDTGNNARIFANNVRAAGVDLSRLDFVVISHRHLDHSAGISHLLSVNPDVILYVPKEPFGIFGGSLPASFLRRDPSLPDEDRYFSGAVPDQLVSGTAFPGAHWVHVEKTTEVAPGVFLIALVSETPGTRELRELSLAVRTPAGLVLVVGCSHPGIERIVEAASAIDPHVSIVFGGFHMPAASDSEISRVATALHDRWKVERLAPGHCTGEPTFAHFKQVWGSAYRHAGVGSVLDLP